MAAKRNFKKGDLVQFKSGARLYIVNIQRLADAESKKRLKEPLYWFSINPKTTSVRDFCFSAHASEFTLVASLIDWVECGQTLWNLRDYDGIQDCRDLCRCIGNLKQHGLPPEQIKILESVIDWPTDTKFMAWSKVYVRFKEMYHAVFPELEGRK